MSEKVEQHGSEDIPPRYEEYLLLLQQRNRLVKKLKVKDKKQQDLERKEQGFSIYLNGANVDLKLGESAWPKTSRKAKTAGDQENREVFLNPVDDGSDSESPGNLRAWTAPSKTKRKGWGQAPGHLKIKTNDGEKVEIKPPGKLSGKYSEDFELYQSFLEQQLAEEDAEDEESGVESDTEEVEVEDESEKTLDEEIVANAEGNLTFTLKDVKALRESLERDKEIKENIQSIREDIEEESSSTDDEIAEDLEMEGENREVNNLQQFGEPTFAHEDKEKDKYTSLSFASSAAESVEVPENMKTWKPPSGAEKKRISSSVRSIASPVNQDEQLHELVITAPRKSRPLSAASRKDHGTANSFNLNSSVITSDIVKAIQEENSHLQGRRADKPDKRQTQTAPEQSNQSEFPSKETELERPSSIATSSISEDTIALVTEKVKRMNKRQQKKLMDLLAELEDVDQIEDETLFLKTTFGDRLLPSKDSKTDERLTCGKDNTSLSGSRKICTAKGGIDVATRVEKVQNDECQSEFCEVYLELLSNWGHPDLLGLTEVQFFDRFGNLIKMDIGRVDLCSGHICFNDPKNLVNGKTKTTSEKYMWKCRKEDHESVELTFHVPVEVSEDNIGISKIAIWNYNRKLNELNIGAKDARIFIGGVLVWEGIIDKGCGNQVFDYSEVIQLCNYIQENESPTQNKSEEIEPFVRSETRTLERHPDDVSGLPRVDSSNISNSSRKMEDAQVSFDKLTFVPIPPSAPPNVACRRSVLSLELSRSRDDITKQASAATDYSNSSLLKSRSISTPNLTSDSVADLPPNDPCERTLSARTSSRNQSTPIWLAKDEYSNRPKSEIKQNEKVSIEPIRARSRPSSGRRSNTPTESSGSGNKKVISMGRRTGTPKLGDEEIVDAFHHLHKDQRDDPLRTFGDQANIKSPGSSSRNRRHSPLDDSSTSPIQSANPKERQKSNRRKYRDMMDQDLEQSFQCIDKFQHSHLGRITSNLDLEGERDALDDFLHSSMESKQESPRDNVSMAEDDIETLFEIPILPSGRHLTLNIKTTWGDQHYVGLNGIEVFTDTGELAPIAEITADPMDINILPEYSHDPRVATNLVDGTFMTRDDLHLWLTPFTKNSNHFVYITFASDVTIAMIRIWNYNKSRIHSTRGARDVEMKLDGHCIFQGEIARASGILSKESEPYGDTILFTVDEDILDAVARNDFTYEYDVEEEDEMMQSIAIDRPKTSNLAEDRGSPERPFTSPKSRPEAMEHFAKIERIPEISEITRSQDSDVFTCQVLQLNFVSTWGDLFYLGLTGLEILGADYEPVKLDCQWMDASPRDLNDLPDYCDDDRTLDKLIDGENITTSDEHMWLIPFAEGDDHILKITFPEPQIVSGIRIWNYNKTQEDTFRGAKNVYLVINGNTMSPDDGFLLRKGPGHCHFDFAQDILFGNDTAKPPLSPQKITEQRKKKSKLKKVVSDYEPLLMPTGFVFQLQLHTSWGDPYYIGLNGLEFYDENTEKIQLTDNNITAYPHSVNVLDGIEDDIRTPDKLIDGFNDTYDGRHMWLAPILLPNVNIIYVVFDQPISVSMIKLWNYSKTGNRGIRQFAVLVDDLLVYNGVLPQVSSHTRAILPSLEMPVSHHTILFTDDEDIIIQERKHLLSSVSLIEQDIQLTNDKSVVNPYINQDSAGKNADPAYRPMTSVTSTRPRR